MWTNEQRRVFVTSLLIGWRSEEAETHRCPLEVSLLQKLPDHPQSFVPLPQHSQRVEADLDTEE